MALSSGATVMGVEWSLVGLSLSFVLMRLAVRIFHHHKSFNLSDNLVICGWFMALGLAICDTRTYLAGGMNPDSTFTDDETIYLLQISYVDDIISDLAFYFPKFSLLALYYGIISIAFRKLRIALYIISAYVVIACIITWSVDTFWCIPISDNWSLDPSVCHIFESNTISYLNWTLNMSSDLSIFILPFFLLKHLRLSSRAHIIGITATFLLGAITILCSAARLTVLEAFLLTDHAPIYILYSTEINVSLILVSIPLLKPFIRRNSRKNTSTTEDSLVITV